MGANQWAAFAFALLVGGMTALDAACAQPSNKHPPTVTGGTPFTLLVRGRAYAFTANRYDTDPKQIASCLFLLTRPDGTEFRVAMNDTGVLVDEKAGDGVYTALIRPDQVGAWRVVTETLSTGGAWTTSISTWCDFVVIDPGATFDRTFGLKADEIDLQKDGLYDRIDVTAYLNVVNTKSRYSPHLEFVDQAGQRFSASTAHVEPKGGGSHKFAVTIDAKDLVSKQAQLPLRLLKAEIWQYTDFGSNAVDVYEPADDQPVVLTMRSLESAQRAPLRFVPPFKYQAIDKDGDGQDDVLRVSVGVTTVKTDRYWFNLDLVQNSGFPVGNGYADNVPLTAGAEPVTLTIDVDAAQLGERGLDGPYFIKDISGRSDNFMICFSGHYAPTPAYRASQFRGFSPPLDRNHNGVPDFREAFEDFRADRNYNGIPDDVDAHPCWMADVADDLGNVPPKEMVPNSGVTEADFKAFVARLPSQPSLADIADDAGNVPPPPGCRNSGANDVDLLAFLRMYFEPCEPAPWTKGAVAPALPIKEPPVDGRLLSNSP